MRAVMEFTQFTGTTVENTKGHWEVTVSAWVSGGWEWGWGGGMGGGGGWRGDRSLCGIVCYCASDGPEC